MSPVRIRPARPEDARAIARVQVETWRSAYPGIIPDRVMIDMSVDAKAAGWRRQLASAGPREGTLVALAVAGGVVGFAGFGPGGAPGHDGEVYTLYVLADWQDRGVGKSLIAGAFRALSAAGMGSALVWVLADNPSRFFYEAMGGKLVGEREERLWGAALREYAYAWEDLPAWLARYDGR